MYKIEIVNKNWELVDTIKVNSVPSTDDLIYIREEDKYYTVNVIIHKVEPRWLLPNKVVITVVISETDKTILKK